MADNIEATTQQEPVVVDEAKQELANQMAFALGNGNVSHETATQNQEVAATETVAETAETVIPPITFEILKDKFNYTSPEDAIKEIEELRVLKTTPPTPVEIKFENEQSEKIFKALQSGKPEDIKGVAAYLAQQERLDAYTSVEVNKDNAADIIKLGMQLKYKDLTSSEIDYKFKKQFALPKEPVQDVTEEDTAFEERKNEWKQQVNDIEMDKILEAKFIKPELEAHKSKLVLPEINATVDQDYENWKKSMEVDPKIEADRIAELKSFTPKTLETKINFNDEANKVAFEFQYEPKVEELNAVVEMVNDIDKFYQRFLGQDGKPDRKGFAKALNFAVNGEAMLLEAMKQSKNATLKSQLPDNNGNGGRQLPQGQGVDALHEHMRQAGITN